MAQISELLHNREVFTVPSHCTVLEAARFMVERNVGAVPILDGERLVGIFSERDIMNRVLVTQLDAAKTRVTDVMSRNPISVHPETPLQDCMVLMKQNGFRHLPVCDGDHLVGFLSLRDLLLREVDEKDDELRVVRAYIANS
jgi:CBS domain-containing protein